MSVAPSQKTVGKVSAPIGPLVKQSHGGAIHRGGPMGYLPIPGPGRKSEAKKRDELTALQAQNEAFEAKVHAEAAELARTAIENWKQGNVAPYKELANRAWGTVEQKVTVEISLNHAPIIAKAVVQAVIEAGAVQYAERIGELVLAKLQEVRPEDVIEAVGEPCEDASGAGSTEPTGA